MIFIQNINILRFFQSNFTPLWDSDVLISHNPHMLGSIVRETGKYALFGGLGSGKYLEVPWEVLFDIDTKYLRVPAPCLITNRHNMKLHNDVVTQLIEDSITKFQEQTCTVCHRCRNGMVSRNRRIHLVFRTLLLSRDAGVIWTPRCHMSYSLG